MMRYGLPMNSAALTVLAEGGIGGLDAELALRHILAELAAPSPRAAGIFAAYGIEIAGLDPSLRTIQTIIRRLADGGLTRRAAADIFGAEFADAAMLLISNIDRLEKLAAPA